MLVSHLPLSHIKLGLLIVVLLLLWSYLILEGFHKIHVNTCLAIAISLCIQQYTTCFSKFYLVFVNQVVSPTKLGLLVIVFLLLWYFIRTHMVITKIPYAYLVIAISWCIQHYHSLFLPILMLLILLIL